MYRGSAYTQKQIQAERAARGVHPFILCLVGLGTFQSVVIVFAAERCPPANATKVVSVQGNVTWSLVNKSALQTAKFDDVLCVGDILRVGVRSRAVLRLPNETTVPLDQNTVFRLKEPVSDKAPTLIELLQGAIHVITRTPKPFKVDTPYLNAAVEGTEFYVAVDDKEARVAVIEGKVNVSNPQGELLLTANEVAAASKGQAPTKVLTIKPRDAVQWTLYYPPVITPRSAGAGTATATIFAESQALFNQGDTAGAIERLDQIDTQDRDEHFHNYRASLLLHVGRADEAERDIAQATQRNTNSSDALSLQTIIAIVKNDKVKALELANQAITVDPKSAAAEIALSYALQANFKIEDALKAAREATLREETNALAWARVAELELSIPNYDKSKEAAERAVKLNPNLSRTQTILGFANLTRIDTKAARESFNQAITLDQADPLPRLGLGLATIREGDIREGREQIEIAASLDPENSLIRSYLGKAYYEEKRDDEAGKQFELAKERDPKDATPYFYDAMRKQTKNRQIEALSEVNKSIALNGNKAIFRSKLVLDSDHATRQANFARVYSTLGMDRVARILAYESLSDDPANYSAHQLISDANAKKVRHEISRASEYLQTQLLKPLSLHVASPQLPYTDLSLPIAGFHTALFEYDLSSIFERNRLHLSVGSLLGNHDTKGREFVLSGLVNNFSASVGHFKYFTDGFRQNSDLSHEISSAFGQLMLSPKISIQAEFRQRLTNQGDISLSFDPTFLFPKDRRDIQQVDSRLGLSYRPSVGSTFIATTSHKKSTFRDTFFDDSIEGRQLFVDKATLSEIQFLQKFSGFNVVTGVGYSEVATRDNTAIDFSISSGVKCPIEVEPCDAEQNFVVRQWNTYIYANLFNHYRVSATVGLSRENYDDESVEKKKWNPKFGLKASVTDYLTIRLATFRTLKRALITHQTIEPTQVVGFNQFYDDVVGSVNTSVAVALDYRFSERVFFGLEVRDQESLFETGSTGIDAQAIPPQRLKTKNIEINSVWLPNSILAISIGAELERYKSTSSISGNSFPTHIRTIKFPIAVRVFPGNGFYGEMLTTSVRQQVDRVDPSSGPSGRSNFNVTDISFGYKLPKKLGEVSLDIRNILNTKFFYQDDNFRSTELRLSQFLPVRRVFLKASLVF